jgi:uncharacterized protein (UPF0264 family)
MLQHPMPRHARTRLLVSVRSAAEARLAVAAGVDLIDIKEPRAGSLGAVSRETLHAILRELLPETLPDGWSAAQLERLRQAAFAGPQGTPSLDGTIVPDMSAAPDATHLADASIVQDRSAAPDALLGPDASLRPDVSLASDALLATTAPLAQRKVCDDPAPARVSQPAEYQAAGRFVAEVACRPIPCSAALGELRDCDLRQVSQLPPELSFAKLGLSDCRSLTDWSGQLVRLWEAMPASVGRVAVYYADARVADAPESNDIIRVAAEHGAAAVLVDTFDKRGGPLLDHWTESQLARFIAEVHGLGMQAVVAGSLCLESIPTVLAHRPDYVAVRGAVCTRSRQGDLDPARLAAVVSLVGNML